jgi:type I restriction enzyme S subunit
MVVKPGYKQTELGVIPVEWGIRSIGQMFQLVNGWAFKPADWKQNGTPIIRIQNLNDPSASFNYSLAPVAERNRIEAGDLLFAWSGTIGTSFGARVWAGPSGVLNQHIFKVHMDQKQITLPFSLLVFARVEDDIAKQAHGFKASFVHVKKSDLVKVSIPLPPIPEQRAIATALGDVDALLGALERLIAKKRDLQQAAMQQLLTGLTRLPGFHGEWGVTRLGNVLEFQVGCPFSSMFFNEKGQGVRLVKNRDLKSDDQIFYYSGKYDKSFLVSNDDVLIGMDGDFLPCRWSKGTALLNQRVGRVVPLAGLDLAFSFYYLQGPLKEIEFATASTTVKHLSHGDIEGIEKPLPSLPEQTAIAAVLTDMDAELAALEQRLTKTRALKQGMLQELLTGRTRLL